MVRTMYHSVVDEDPRTTTTLPIRHYHHHCPHWLSRRRRRRCGRPRTNCHVPNGVVIHWEDANVKRVPIRAALLPVLPSSTSKQQRLRRLHRRRKPIHPTIPSCILHHRHPCRFYGPLRHTVLIPVHPEEGVSQPVLLRNPLHHLPGVFIPTVAVGFG